MFQPGSLSYTLADGGQSVVTAGGTFAGLSVSREVTVPNTGSQDFARTVDTFTNSTGSPITTTVKIVGDLGSECRHHRVRHLRRHGRRQSRRPMDRHRRRRHAGRDSLYSRPFGATTDRRKP